MNNKPKRIQILTLGTTGDVIPFISLALNLKKLGYDVGITTGENYENLVKKYGIDYSKISVDMNQLMQGKEIQLALSKNPLNYFKLIKTFIKPVFKKIYDETLESSINADAILAHPKCMNGLYIAEKYKKPFIACSTVPMFPPTNEFPFITFRARTYGPFNRLTYALLPFSKMFILPMLNQWRKEALNLAPISAFSSPLEMNGKQVPALYCYSKHLLPKPADWGENLNVSGFWFLDQKSNWEPPQELQNFLGNGSKPIYIGFGSMLGKDPERLTKEVIEGVKKSGQRCIIATGWGGLKDIEFPESIYKLDYAPHDWLFPQVSAVVHHGGAGTTAAGLRYGKPTIICPFMVDQYFWGHRIQEQGVGPKQIPQNKLTAKKLAKAIDIAVNNKEINKNAQILAKKINNENGSENAAKFIDQYIKLLGFDGPNKLERTKRA